jgi:hypothetical protein
MVIQVNLAIKLVVQEIIFFYYYRLKDLKNQLMINNFLEINLFKYDYKKSEFLSELHIVLIAKKSVRF